MNSEDEASSDEAQDKLLEIIDSLNQQAQTKELAKAITLMLSGGRNLTRLTKLLSQAQQVSLIKATLEILEAK